MSKSTNIGTLNVRLRLREFVIPPITDALVLGKDAPIGTEAIRRALSLLQVAPFEHIPVNDDVIQDILVRKNVLRKISMERLIELVLTKVKPYMGTDEVTHLDLYPELTLEDQL